MSRSPKPHINKTVCGGTGWERGDGRSWSQLPHQPSLLATFQALPQNKQTNKTTATTHTQSGWPLRPEHRHTKPQCLRLFCSSVGEHLDCLLVALSSRHILRQISTSFSFWWAFGDPGCDFGETANCFQFKMRAVREQGWWVSLGEGDRSHLGSDRPSGCTLYTSPWGWLWSDVLGVKGLSSLQSCTVSRWKNCLPQRSHSPDSARGHGVWTFLVPFLGLTWLA